MQLSCSASAKGQPPWLWRIPDTSDIIQRNRRSSGPVFNDPSGHATCAGRGGEARMTRSSVLAIGPFIVSLIACVPPASAQTVAGNEWNHGTTLGVFAGSATAAPETRGTLGAALGWEINHRVELEGTGAWLVARQGDEAFARGLTRRAAHSRVSTNGVSSDHSLEHGRALQTRPLSLLAALTSSPVDTFQSDPISASGWSRARPTHTR